MENMDRVAALENDLVTADRIISVLVVKFGGMVEITPEDVQAAMDPGEVIASRDPVKDTFTFKWVTAAGRCAMKPAEQPDIAAAAILRLRQRDARTLRDAAQRLVSECKETRASIRLTEMAAELERKNG